MSETIDFAIELDSDFVSFYTATPLPGTRFYLNGAAEPVIVGTTGIFELSLLNQNFGISDLQFNHQSLEIIEQAETGYLIIDIIYDSEVQA